ncbi:MAG: Hsp70 family protein [Comamonadaceae bacterium]|nr:Hsp70 family protein [Comamonadaceae bacterium]
MTFDIDANGILHVSAPRTRPRARSNKIVDQGQLGGLTEDEIKRMVQDAEAHGRGRHASSASSREARNRADALRARDREVARGARRQGRRGREARKIEAALKDARRQSLEAATTRTRSRRRPRRCRRPRRSSASRSTRRAGARREPAPRPARRPARAGAARRQARTRTCVDAEFDGGEGQGAARRPEPRRGSLRLRSSRTGRADAIPRRPLVVRRRRGLTQMARSATTTRSSACRDASEEDIKKAYRQASR